MSTRSDLLDAIGRTELGALGDVKPEALLDQPWLLSESRPEAAAARAIAYGRRGEADSYDEIGFRTFAASPRRGAVPLQTIGNMRREHRRERIKGASEDLRRIQREQQKLRHRPLALPDSVSFRYAVGHDTIDIVETVDDDGSFAETRTWTFALSDPPEILTQRAISDDVGPIGTQRLQVDIPGAHWLPVKTVIETGRFPRFQDCRGALSTETRPHRIYLFVSHRWLTPESPDPEGRQAGVAAWQVFGYLCEAVRVAHFRGLDVPRKKSPELGFAIGPAGSELAEALIVNVLRQALTPDCLGQAAEEARAVEPSVADRGVREAFSDAGLGRLRAILDGSPQLAALLDRVYLWYDYSCMPQEPRDEADEAIFRDGLRYLTAFQVLGRTVVLLDDVEDFLLRAWCTLEALVADTSMNAIDLLVGSERPTLLEGRTETFFENLMKDRPHLVWRAALDTEVFAVQSARTCMRRLGLDATKPEDLDFIYGRIRDLQAPTKIHVDDSEIVTGVLPLAVLPDSARLLIPRQAGQTLVPDAEHEVRSLDWTESLGLSSLAKGDAARRVAGTPSFVRLDDADAEGAGSWPCHVAVVAGCEGEACLLANWALSRRGDLRRSLGVAVASASWVASDIAPVGHLVDGGLQAVPVEATAWVIVTLDQRLRHCGVTAMILEALETAGHWHATVAVDREAMNVAIRHAPGGGDARRQWEAEAFEKADPDRVALPRHAGGLFRWALTSCLTQATDDTPERTRSAEP